MIKFFSSWVKTLGLAIVIISILEMLLPNNKTKKYIRMVMGIYILFTIISPFVSNKKLFDINNIDFEDYVTKQTSGTLNQTSMDRRIEDLYTEQLEKDITKKLSEKDYKVENCIVDVQISDKEEETKIKKIKLKLEKLKTEEKEENKSLENQIVVQIQKIKPVNTSVADKEERDNNNYQGTETVSKSDIQKIKKFLIEEYGVDEKCLEIN